MAAYEMEAHELELEGLGELAHECEQCAASGELELEQEMELETEISPVRKIYPDAMMEHLAHMAAEAESEQEAAEHFLPIVGLAAKKLLPVVARAAAPAIRKAIPRIARAVTQVEPQLTRGIGRIARTLYRSPGTRRLLHAVPSIARRTVYNIARQVASGRPLTARGAIRTLARQTQRVLGSHHRRNRAIRHSHIMDRHLHHHMGPGMVRPHTHAPAGVSYGPPAWSTYGPGPAPAYTPAAPAPGAAPRPMRGGVCPPCPGCAAVHCRCCGQVVRW